jgi:hypothetical protein
LPPNPRRIAPRICSDLIFDRHRVTHFLTKTLPKVAAEMALCVLAYNLTRVMNIVGTKQLLAAIAA